MKPLVSCSDVQWGSSKEFTTSLFCSHDWAPRTGMDSGSYCQRCSAVSDKECITGSGLSEGRLRTSLYIPHSETKAKQSVASLVGRAFGLIT